MAKYECENCAYETDVVGFATALGEFYIAPCVRLPTTND